MIIDKSQLPMTPGLLPETEEPSVDPDLEGPGIGFL
jgi:hypothetical protein